MTQLVWGESGQRFYETGLDRGVLYVGDDSTIWPGLVSITESPTGGEARPYYQDGFKYLNTSAFEEFEATLTSYASPTLFDECDGTKSILPGFFTTQQTRKDFGLTYRTRIGNDSDGPEHGYKLHLIYNARAEPASRSNQTISDSIEPLSLSWKISTKPPALSGYRPTSHVVIDSRKTPEVLLDEIQGLLYGSEVNNPKLVTIPELISIFNSI